MAESSRGNTTPTAARAATGAATPETIPLLRRFPGLSAVPRVSLGRFPTPVERAPSDLAASLWIKRDDLAGDGIGGNKVRALEFLLARLRPGDAVVTAGGVGSTHVLATAHHARALGGRPIAVRWRHDMNPVGHAVAEHAAGQCERVRETGGPIRSVVLAVAECLARRAMWVQPGGTTPVGILGHVNAALELAEQIAAGELPRPDRVVLPLGTGGTAAGIALGFAVAGLDISVIGARVVPRIAGNRSRVLRLAHATARVIERHTGERLPRVEARRLRIVHDVYGGAYGRALPEASRSAALLERATGVRLDATYSAKAFAAALAIARGETGGTLFWLTFDARWMRDTEERS